VGGQDTERPLDAGSFRDRKQYMNVPSCQEAMDTEVIHECCSAFTYEVAVASR
jgi:hypothetical protein